MRKYKYLDRNMKRALVVAGFLVSLMLLSGIIVYMLEWLPLQANDASSQLTDETGWTSTTTSNISSTSDTESQPSKTAVEDTTPPSKTAETTTTEETTEETTAETTASETTTETTGTEAEIDLYEENVLITSQDQYSDDMWQLVDKTLGFLGNRVLNMGIYYYDLYSDAFFAINPADSFRSASTAKVFTLMAMYDAVEKGELNLEQEVAFTEDDYEAGSGIIRHMDEPENLGSFSLDELAEYALIHSDNIAYHMIMRTVGPEQVYDYYESVIGHPTDRNQTEMSAAGAKALLLHLYNHDNSYFSQMIETMRYSVYRNALPRYLPKYSVSNKIGFFDEVFHDMGIVHDSENPYLMAVFSENIREDFDDEPADLLAELAKLIDENR